MGNYLPLLIILVCPLMMIFMMRGMHGGRDMGGHDIGDPDRDPGHAARAPRVDPEADQRINDLERQVAELSAERDRTESAARRR